MKVSLRWHPALIRGRTSGSEEELKVGPTFTKVEIKVQPTEEIQAQAMPLAPSGQQWPLRAPWASPQTCREVAKLCLVTAGC